MSMKLVSAQTYVIPDAGVLLHVLQERGELWKTLGQTYAVLPARIGQ